MRKALSLVLALLLVAAAIPVAADGLDADVQKGIAQVDDGDYDGAILTLDNAARRLAADKAKPNDLAQAYLYLGIAYIGKGREAAAKAKFREAVAQIKTLSLSADKFPPKVVDLFEAAKAEETRATPALSPAPAASGSPSASVPEKKKGGSGKAILIVGGLAAVGGIAAAAGGGGSKGAAASTPGTATSQTLNFTGTLPSGASECKQVVATKAGTLDARITWTNGQIELSIGCQEHDPPYIQCAGVANRTSNTTATYTVPVTQKSYDICPANYSGASDTYTLVIQVP